MYMLLVRRPMSWLTNSWPFPVCVPQIVDDMDLDMLAPYISMDDDFQLMGLSHFSDAEDLALAPTELGPTTSVPSRKRLATEYWRRKLRYWLSNSSIQTRAMSFVIVCPLHKKSYIVISVSHYLRLQFQNCSSLKHYCCNILSTNELHAYKILHFTAEMNCMPTKVWTQKCILDAKMLQWPTALHCFYKTNKQRPAVFLSNNCSCVLL